MTETPPSAPRAALRLGLALALLYGLATGGRVSSPDGVVMAWVTESLVERGELAVAHEGYPEGFLTTGADGRRYAKYGLGMPLAGVPFYLLGRGLEAVAPPGAQAVFAGPKFLWYDPLGPSAWRFFGISLTSAALAGATCAFLFLLAVELGCPRRAALAAALVAALASPLVVYAKTFFSEPLSALGLTLFAYGAARWARLRNGGSAVLGGVGLAVAVAAKVAHLVLVPLAAGAILASLLRSPLAPRRRLRDGALFAAPLAGWLLVMAAVNTARFGDPLATGYGAEVADFTTPWREGLAGLLLSPGRGLLVYFPALVLSAAATPAVWRRTRVWAAAPWLALLALLALYCRWHGWDGGWCWGPRFFVPLLPLLCLPIAFLVARPPRQRALRAVAWTLVALSAAVNLPGVLVAFTEYHAALREVLGNAHFPAMRWSWSAFPPLLSWWLPKGYLLAPRAFATPAAWWLAASFAAGGVLFVPLAERAVRSGLGAVPRQRGRRRLLGWLAAATATAALSGAAVATGVFAG